jgi:uridine monophosphate synthetase
MSWNTRKEEYAREIVSLLYAKGLIRTFYRDSPRGWTLISGLYSPLYVQLRPLASHPRLFAQACRAMAAMIREETPHINKVVGIAMAGVPLAAGIALYAEMPAGFTRKLEGARSLDSLRETLKTYGEHTLVEGELAPGDRIALVDDLVTKFDSKLIAAEQTAREAERRNVEDVDCRTVAVLIDREQGGARAAHDAGMALHALIPLKTLGLPLLESVMAAEEWDVITRYLDSPDEFQSAEARLELERMGTAAQKGT